MKAEKQTCISCRLPKADQECGVCTEPVCRGCAEFVDNTRFSFREELDPKLKHSYYCANCFETELRPELESYDAMMEKARGINVFFAGLKHPLPILKRARYDIAVKDCLDRDETILRLAFKAAEQGFNSIVEMEISHRKVRDEGYQKTLWSGTARPANADEEKLARRSDDY